jgi:hypothetical protein
MRSQQGADTTFVLSFSLCVLEDVALGLTSPLPGHQSSDGRSLARRAAEKKKKE